MPRKHTCWARFLGGTALLLLASAPALSAPMDAKKQAELEARLQAMEALLQELKTELATERAARIEATAKQQVATAAPAPAPAAAATPTPSSDGFKIGDTTFKISGFIKTDAIWSRYSGGDLGLNDLGRDFYVPALIPVGNPAAKEKVDFDAHVKQTRIMINTSTPVGGHMIGTHLEGDFQSARGTEGDDRITNVYNFAIRRAFVTFDRWTVGQDWSTFQNVAVLPETPDFIGPTEGTVFVRQPVLRYAAKNGLTIALENPEATVTPFNGGTRITADDERFPDIIARYDRKGNFGEFAIAGIVRFLSYNQGDASANAIGWGASVSGRLKLGARDDLRAMVTYGSGIGRYVGLNFVNDAVLSSTTAAVADLSKIDVLSGFIAYKHFWTDKARSTISFSYLNADTPSFGGATANDQSWSGAVNLFYTLAKGFDMGVEYRHANRELRNGTDGNLDRLHFVAKRSF